MRYHTELPDGRLICVGMGCISPDGIGYVFDFDMEAGVIIVDHIAGRRQQVRVTYDFKTVDLEYPADYQER